MSVGLLDRLDQRRIVRVDRPHAVDPRVDHMLSDGRRDRGRGPSRAASISSRSPRSSLTGSGQASIVSGVGKAGILACTSPPASHAWRGDHDEATCLAPCTCSGHTWSMPASRYGSRVRPAGHAARTTQW